MEIKAPKFNVDDLYEVKTYTDIILGSIIHSSPIKVFAHEVPCRDSLRQDKFTGTTILHTTRGPMNITFDIPAGTLHEAVMGFDTALKKMMDDMQVQSLRNHILTGGKNPIGH